MDRRTALLLLSPLLGSVGLGRLFAQEQEPRPKSSPKSRGGASDPPPKKKRARDAQDDQVDEPKGKDDAGDDPPADFPGEKDRSWKQWDIADYTALPHKATSPAQNAILEWIFRRTGSATWHDDKISALSASRSRIKAYHTAKTLQQVDDVIVRFTDSVSDFISLRVRIVAAADPRWRYLQFAQMTTLGSGPQGQKIWTLSPENATALLTRMEDFQGYQNLANNSSEVINGQTLKINVSKTMGYDGSLTRDGGAAQGYQPKSEQLVEGVELKLSPLLTYDGDALELAVELTANTIRTLHKTKVFASRDVGPNEASIDVPEVASTRLSQSVKSWPLKETLMISAGILPGILHPNKNGFLNLRLPGTVPNGTEVLVFIDANAIEKGRTSRGE